MRKILISILICLLLIGSAFFMVNGISNLNIQGVKGLSQKNSQIDKKISDLSNVISVTYVNSEANLKRTANTLQDSKTEYENQAILSNSQDPSYISQLETYDIDYLWTKLGNHARSENVVIKIELVASGSSTNLYNLNFTVTGEYVGITDFIYDIENDSKLGFKIDEFQIGNAGDSKLDSTFSCKEIPINVGSIDKETSESDGTSDTTDSTTGKNTTTNTSSSSSNTTNTNKSNTTTNSTSSSSKATNSSSVSTGGDLITSSY